MKSCVALVMFCLMTVGTIQAQKVESNAVHKIAETTQIDVLAQKLGLTVEQKANVEKTMTSFAKTRNRINSSTLSEADKATKLTAINARMEGNLKTYLSEEQFVKYTEIKNNQKQF